MDSGPLTIDQVGEALAGLLIQAQRLNEGPDRCRELSLCITNLEQSIHWLLSMFGVYGAGRLVRTTFPPESPTINEDAG